MSLPTSDGVGGAFVVFRLIGAPPALAQAGQRIDQTHAEHMVAHAPMVIQATQAPSEP